MPWLPQSAAIHQPSFPRFQPAWQPSGLTAFTLEMDAVAAGSRFWVRYFHKEWLLPKRLMLQAVPKLLPQAIDSLNDWL